MPRTATHRPDAELDAMRAAVAHLASIERPSASAGEHAAAAWIVARLRELGLDARIETERAHGGYWWPLGLPNAAAALAAGWLGRRPRSAWRRLAAALAGAAGAAAIADDVGGGRMWFRRPLQRRQTANVIAEAGDPRATDTLVFVAHHDAAHSGLVFHPFLPSIGPRYLGRLHERSTQTIPIMYAVWLGPLLVALGAATGAGRLRRAGLALAAGATAAMADIGRRGAVPGANDNLSAVAVVLALARRLRDAPLEGVRVLLVSTGSEESFMEGMRGFAARHLQALDPERTDVVCLECVGSPELHVLEAEGMLRMRPYTPELKGALVAAARRAGVEPGRGLSTVAATDGLISLRAGYRTATLCAVDEARFPANYHWPTDTPENLSWPTIEQALETCWSLVQMRAAA